MHRNALKRETIEEAHAALAKHGTLTKAAEALGISRSTLKNRIDAKARLAQHDQQTGQEKFRHTDEGERGTLESVSSARTTAEECFAFSKLDPDIWEIERSVVNQWDAIVKDGEGANRVVQMYQIKVWVRRKVAKRVTDALDIIAKMIPAYTVPKRKRTPKTKRGEYLLVWAPFDHHFGKLAWAPETGEDYDVEIAESRFLDSARQALDATDAHAVSHILIPLGHDFLNVDGPRGETYAGTPQDEDGRWARVFSRAFRAAVDATRMLADRAPVTVQWVPGNHDLTASYHLCFALKQFFRKDRGVSIDVSPPPRKYFRWGVNLIASTHGDQEKHASLPVIMAQERPQDWAETTTRAWLLGHWHKKKETRWNAVDTIDGVTVTICPSLSGRDAWHYSKGYGVGSRTSEAYLYHRDRGYSGHVVTHVREESAA